MRTRGSLNLKQSMPLTAFIKNGSWGLLLFIGIAAGWHGLSQVQATPSSDIVYSTNGGVTWTTTPTAKSGQEMLVRLYYDNDTSGTIQTLS